MQEPSKKIKFLRYFTYWLYVLLYIGIPITLIAWQFKLFDKPGKIQITGYGIIAIIVVIFLTKGLITKAISELNNGILRTFLQNIMHIIPLIAFWLALVFLETLLVKVKFILFWSMLGCIAAFGIDIWHTILVKKCNEEKENTE